MNSYNYSYNVLINRLEAFAAGHFLIKRFTHGQIDLADQLQDDQYPFMHVTPDTITPIQGGMQFGFLVMFADIPRDKEYKAEYQREVISDCIRLGQDLIAEVRNGLELFGFDVQLVNIPTFEPFIEEYKNTVTGIAFTLTLEVPWDWSACDIPAVWSVGGSSSGGSGTGYGLTLRTNGVDNAVQNILDLVEGTNVTITDNGDGSVTIDAAGGGGGSGEYVSTEWNANHTTAQGNPYQIGDRVWYNGSVYRCIANNDGINPTNPTYWTLQAVGYRLRQTPVDWNATSGDYQILNKPTIPAAQVNSDWDAVSGVAEILNKPTLATVATSGDYNDLINQPYIPTNLDDLADVNVAGVTNGQVLTYNTLLGDWIATTPSTGGGILHGTASGTDTYTVTIAGAGAYADGDAYLIRFPNGNTSGCTLNINGQGAIPLYRNNDGLLIGGDIWDGAEMLCIYNSTTSGFQCIGTSSNSLFAYVTNAESVTTITKGQPVYAFGGTGDRLTVKLANNSSDATSAQTVGIVVNTSIAPNQKGIIIISGQLDNLSTLPTSTFADGDPIYLGATAGSITNVKPYAPNHLVYLGFVTTASPGNAGRMYVRVQNGYELDELHNVVATAPANNDYMYYDSSTSLYRLRQLTAAQITDATTVGQNVVKLTNPSAVSFIRVNADNTVTARTPSQVISDLGIANQIILNKNFADTSAITGTTTPTIAFSVLIPANTLQANDWITSRLFCRTTGTGGTNFNVYINTSAAIPGGGTIIGQWAAAANQAALFERNWMITAAGSSGNLKYLPNTGVSAYTPGNFAFGNLTVNTTVDQYLVFVAVNGATTASATTNGNVITIIR
jgi:hypothetical protein